jgi:cell division protein FtsZ
MGIGSATGKDKAQEAASMAIASPLLETSIKGATGVIISFSVSPDVGLEDVDLAANMVTNECNPDANIIFGVGFDESLEDEMRITIIATGFTKESNDASVKVAAAAPTMLVAEEAPKAAPKAAPAAVKAEPEAAIKITPKKESDALDLDDLLGDLF